MASSSGSFRASASMAGSSPPRRSESMGDLIRRGSLADAALHASIMELRAAAPAQIDPDDVSASMFPMLFSLERQVDDLLLQEVYTIIKGAASIHTAPLSSWVAIPTVNSVFHLGTTRPQLVGGMLFAGGDFLFEELPFVLAKEKQVRCRLDLSDEELTTALSVNHSGGGAGGGGGGGPGTDGTAPAGKEMSLAAAARRRRSEGVRVYFQLHEFESVTDDWIVQSLQLVGPDGPRGRIFTRAFTPKDYTAVVETEAGGRQLRNAVHGEEKLRVLKPWLYQWCLARDPKDLGAAAMVVRAILSYYKHTFSVVRMVRTLMRSIRTVQKFTRKMLRRKHVALDRMLAQWQRIEAEKHLALQRYVPAAGDCVDQIVHETLLRNSFSSPDEKTALIAEKWAERRRAWCRAMRQAASAMLPGIAFAWFIDPHELFAEWQQRSIKRLSQGENSIFAHDAIKRLQRDIPRELQQMPKGTVRSRKGDVGSPRRQ